MQFALRFRYFLIFGKAFHRKMKANAGSKDRPPLIRHSFLIANPAGSLTLSAVYRRTEVV
jgi:hypothetical protein